MFTPNFRKMIHPLAALIAVSLSAQSAFAAKHETVTAFNELQTRLVLKPGQTFLSFMQNKVKPGLDAFEATIKKDSAYKANRYSQLQQNLIEQGAGVAIRIDSDNYIFNIGYLDGSDPQNDVKSGRSYGVGPSGKESDPSDVAYLKELEAFLTSEPDSAGPFVEALMKVLTNCDTSGWSKLSTEGQIVATDFVAIYTAELDRHLMVDLNPRKHPWEIDLAAATFVSIFDTASGLLMQNGALVEGSITDWWAKGTVGSGIGETRRDRLALQKLIAKSEAESEEAAKIAKIIGADTGSDLIQGVLLFLNSTDAPTDMSRGAAKSLSQLVTDYLVNVQKHSGEIAKLK